jgi:hypothetical protein
MYQNFMLPVVGVTGRETAGRNGENPHAEIGGAILYSDRYSASYSFDRFSVEVATFQLIVV